MNAKLDIWSAAFMLVILSGCTAGMGTVDTGNVTGCYEPAIGPYLGDVTALETPLQEAFLPPTYYELIRREREEWTSPGADDGRWLEVRAPETSGLEMLQKVGGWSTIGNDSIVIQWRGEYNVTEYRLQVAPQGLKGQGSAVAHLPNVEPATPTAVTARRITCPDG